MYSFAYTFCSVFFIAFIRIQIHILAEAGGDHGRGEGGNINSRSKAMNGLQVLLCSSLVFFVLKYDP